VQFKGLRISDDNDLRLNVTSFQHLDPLRATMTTIFPECRQLLLIWQAGNYLNQYERPSLNETTRTKS